MVVSKHFYQTGDDKIVFKLELLGKFFGLFDHIQLRVQLNNDTNGIVIVDKVLLLHFAPDLVSFMDESLLQ